MRCQHTWENGKCKYCGANRAQYDRVETIETYAYPFIHKSIKEILNKNMQFDVIIGNPPYQMSSNADGIQAIPLYHHFVEQAKKLSPHYLIMIIPARWYTGGMGMNDFRQNMLRDKHIKALVDYPKSRECFQGVDIAGGICYFLWDKSYNGPCNVTNILNGTSNTMLRNLNDNEIFIRDNVGVSIINKVSCKNNNLSMIVYPISPFGLPTSTRGENKPFDNSCVLISSQGRSYISESMIRNKELMKKYKVYIGQLNPDRAGVNNSSDGKMNVTTKIYTALPNEVTTATYLVIGDFYSQREADNYTSYIKTKFSRFLISLTLSSMHITKQSFQFVPLQDFSHPWTDEMLYKKYNLDKDEIAFIESMIRPME